MCWQHTLVTASLSCTAARASHSLWSGQAPSGSMLLRKLPLNSTGSCSADDKRPADHVVTDNQLKPSYAANNSMINRAAKAVSVQCSLTIQSAPTMRCKQLLQAQQPVLMPDAKVAARCQYQMSGARVQIHMPLPLPDTQCNRQALCNTNGNGTKSGSRHNQQSFTAGTY